MNTSLVNTNIQFLRGFSVIIVFFFHYNTKIFNSLFVGVDIFFLVSGYVITASIFGKQRFIFFDYCLRRFKRIYPNLIFISLIFFISYFFLYEKYAEDFSTNFFSILFSLFGASNLFYSINPQLFYFNDEIRWLIHTWSLSVEIQFYLIFGLIALVYFNLSKKILIKKEIVLFFLFCFFSVSLILFSLTNIKFFSDYYSMPGRFWEFLLGSFLFFYKPKKILNFNQVFIIFALVLFFLNVLNLNYKIVIIFSLISIFLILNFSKEHNINFISKLFSYFGKISYSFYLWHLIILSFLKNYFDFYVINFLITFFITTLLSHITYYMIEARFNKKYFFDEKLKKIIKFFFYVFIFFTIYFFVNKTELKKPFYKLNQFSIKLFHFVDKTNVWKNKKDNYQIVVQRYDNCEKNYENFSWHKRINCLKDGSNENLIYLFGDSFVENLIPSISKISNINFIQSRFEATYFNFDKMNNINYDYLVNNYNNISKNFINNLIIISINETNLSSKKIINFKQKIKDDNVKIILVYPYPSLKMYQDNKGLEDYFKVKKQNLKLINSFPNFVFYDPFYYLCKNCTASEYEEKFRKDGGHLNLKGSLLLLESLKNIIKKNL